MPRDSGWLTDDSERGTQGSRPGSSLPLPESSGLSPLDAWRALSPAEQTAQLNVGMSQFRPSTAPDGGRLRVGLWSPVLFEAGAEAWMLSLVRATAESVSWRGLTISEGRAAVAPLMAERFEGLMPVGYGRNACRALAADCDVIVSWAMSDVPGLLDGLTHRPKIVSVCHAPVESEWGMNTYRDPAGIDAYVAVSELALGPICAEHRSEARVIWNAVDEIRLVVRRDRATMRRLWDVPADAPVVGFLGRLAPEKDPFALARLVACLAPRVAWGRGGRGAPPPQIQAMANELGCADRLHLVGADHAAGDVLSAFDVLLVPSDYESFCLSLAEGFWMGVPVVSGAVGLARMVPGLVREIPLKAGGSDLAAALLADVADPEGTRSAGDPGERLRPIPVGLARFGREWTEFLQTLVTPRAVRLARVHACPDRGSVLPVSMQDECGCQGKELSECRKRKGKHPGRVTLRDCLSCQT